MYLLAYLLTYRRIAATSSILVCAHLRRRPRRENTHNAGAEYIYIYALIHVYQARPSLKRRRKPTTISREKDVSPVFLATRHSIFFFLTLSLSLSFRLASERTSEQTMRGYEARTSYRSFCLTERIFIGGKKKKMNALCSINPL